MFVFLAWKFKVSTQRENVLNTLIKTICITRFTICIVLSTIAIALITVSIALSERYMVLVMINMVASTMLYVMLNRNQ